MESFRSSGIQRGCLPGEDPPAPTIHLDYPLQLRKGRFPGETSCLSLCWAVLDLIIAGARGLGLTAFERQQLAQMRSEHLTPLTDEELTAQDQPAEKLRRESTLARSTQATLTFCSRRTRRELSQ